MTMMAFLYTIWRYWEFKHRRLSRIEADALQVRGKHQGLVVDVERLPAPVWNEETTVEVGSLDELIKTADAILKPVLRLAEPERHTYCVIDGMTRYQYVSLRSQYVSLSKLVPPPQPKPPPTDETESP